MEAGRRLSGPNSSHVFLCVGELPMDCRGGASDSGRLGMFSPPPAAAIGRRNMKSESPLRGWLIITVVECSCGNCAGCDVTAKGCEFTGDDWDGVCCDTRAGDCDAINDPCDVTDGDCDVAVDICDVTVDICDVSSVNCNVNGDVNDDACDVTVEMYAIPVEGSDAAAEAVTGDDGHVVLLVDAPNSGYWKEVSGLFCGDFTSISDLSGDGAFTCGV
jgi:hypothetical protein